MKTIRTIGVYSNGNVQHNAAVRILEDWYSEAQINELLAGREVEVEDGDEVEFHFLEDDE